VATRSPKGTTYLLHFSQLISPAHTCQHYLGWTPGAVADRLAEHAAGRGARLTQVAIERGIAWRLVRTWEGETRTDERRHKRGAHGRRLCPLCRASGGQKGGERQE
jgi:predicted GIY-YIG superfamily endonuclease